MSSKSVTVMVVDDEVNLCRALSRILTKEGYEVSVAHDGDEALKLLEQNNPDIALLDLVMPGMDGREVCRFIRSHSPLTRVIYFTAKPEASKQPALKELRAEANGVIAKPARSARILAEVKRVLPASKMTESTAV